MNIPLKKGCILLFLSAIITIASAPLHMLPAQALNHILGQLIVHLPKGKNPNTLINQHAIFENTPTLLKVERTLSEDLNIHLYSFDYQNINENRLLNKIKHNADVLAAQFNHFISPRNTWPNDPYMVYQWHWLNTGGSMGTLDADIDAELAWDITTGGSTPAGTEIVIALLDDGLDLNHEDFQGNFWVNQHEIPDNGIDDDGNGYIDDYYGWNVIAQNDYIGYGTHGTQVAGLMGAQGNNGLGISGLNWQVKIMPVYSDWALESEVVEGYSYVLANRRLYNETNGEKGAFVVATNLSWGVDGVFATEAPVWCAIYDSLGAAGILNVGAASNIAWDVDLMGDLPTTCTSDYFLGVTATTEYDELSTTSYGAISIDVAAPGRNIYTTESFNNYQFSSGTSFAAPQVTALAALLYAAPCNYLEELSWEEPAAAVQLVKESILQGTDPLNSLNGLVATGGRINAYKSLLWLLSVCGNCLPPPTLNAQPGPEDGSLQISWTSPQTSSMLNIYLRKAGEAVWTILPNQSSPLTIHNLDFCSKYEVKAAHTCSNGETLFGPTSGNVTEGCCRPPITRDAEVYPDENLVLLRWEPTIDATEYLVQYRPEGNTEWTEVVTPDSSLALYNLNPCAAYSWRVLAICAFLPTLQDAPTNSFTFPDCETCTQTPYCLPDNPINTFEWIEKVRVADWEWQSGQQEAGYALIHSPQILRLVPEQNYEIAVLPEGAAFWEENLAFWIDLNQNGHFSDPGELLWATAQTVTLGSWASGQFSLPPNLPQGYYRIRLSMWWDNPDNTPSNPDCFEPGIWGEVEDYCAYIGYDSCPLPENIQITATDEQSLTLSWEVASAAPQSYTIHYYADGDDVANTLTINAQQGSQALLQQLQPCRTYHIRIETHCNGDSMSSEWTSFFLEGHCSPSALLQATPYPSVFSNEFYLDINPPTYTGTINLQWYAVSGKLLYEERFRLDPGHPGRLSPNVTRLPSGLLLLKVQTQSGEELVMKVLKER